jgi:CBS domain-containing protein
MKPIPRQAEDFLRTCAPFDGLDDSELNQLASKFYVAYLTNENQSEIIDASIPSLFLVQSGQYAVKDSNGAVRHLSEGEYFGYSALLLKQDHSLCLTVDNPGLVYRLAAEDFYHLTRSFPFIESFFHSLDSDTQHSIAVESSNSMWLHKSLDQVISGIKPICTNENTSIHTAAQLMAKQGISSLLVTENDKLCGIITDRDLRNRVLATGRDPSQPISEIMTRQPVSMSRYNTLFDAKVCMSEHGISHLPVVDITHQPLGIVTSTDLIKHQRGNVLFAVDELTKANSLYELSNAAWKIPQYLAAHAKRLGDFDIAGKVLSQATDIMTRKLLTFFQQQHGKAPLAYCWLVYGSQAREDQTMGSDQDNGLLLSETPNDEQADYFARLAEYVCEGLGKCGIKRCPGNIMASNPDLRLSLVEAVSEAKSWVTQPTNKAIMYFNIFLDARAIAGDRTLFERLCQARAPLFKTPIFLAALARHANDSTVPLSLFRQFVTVKNDKNKGYVPINCC